MKKITYTGKEQKLYKVLEGEIKFFGYSLFHKLLRKGDVKVNSKRIKEEITVKAGDVIEVYVNDNLLVPPSFLPKEIYSDDNIVILYKNKGIPSVGEDGIEELASAHYGTHLYLCHRLDTNTEGLLILAKNTAAFESVKKAFKNHLIEKYYLCYVYGKVDKARKLEGFLVKNEETGFVKIYDKKVENSLPIVTEINPLSYRDGCTLLDVKLVTGRTHQIRAHLKYRGYPVIGDSKYGLESVNRDYAVKGQALFAYKLIFGTLPAPLGYLSDKPFFVSTDAFEKMKLLKKIK